MILTVTLNPMVDKTIFVDRFPHGQITRAHRVENVAGGKGVNVSRQLLHLSVESVATGFLGGEVGRIIEDLMTSEGIHHDFVRVRDTTRIAFTVLESETGVQTSVFEPGHRVAPEEVRQLKGKVVELLRQRANARDSDCWLVCSGTAPCEGMDDLYAELILAANELGVPAILDTYYEPLAIGIQAKPFMVKPNAREFEMTFGGTLQPTAAEDADATMIRALDQLMQFGVRLAIITQGDQPSYVAFDDRAWRVSPPSIETVNPIGSGDSMIAGLLYGFTQRWEIEDILRFGAAAGAANARVWKVAGSSLGEINRLAPQVKLQRVR